MNKRKISGLEVAIVILVIVSFTIGITAFVVTRNDNSGKSEFESKEVVDESDAAPPAGSWQTVIDMTGSTTKQTPTFYLGAGEKRLLYNYIPNEYGGVLAIYVMKDGTSITKQGGFPEATPEIAGPGETRLTQEPGVYYLHVGSTNCEWQVTIQEMK
jgi:hypothetical protein